MSRVLILAVILIVLVSSVHAQEGKYIVRGSVADSSTGERIPYATVMLKGTSIGVHTDGEGYFVLAKIPAGLRRVVVSAVGYKTKTFEMMSGSNVVNVTFYLPQEPTTFAPVEVTGRYESLNKPVAPSTTVLYTRDMEKATGILENDLVQAVTQLPGVVTIGGISSQYYVRGGASDQNLVQIDGIRIYNLFHAFGLFSFIDPLIVKAADMNTGGYQAEYGGRLSSVLDVMTKDGDKRNYSVAGNVDLLSSDLMISGPLPVDIGKGKTSFIGFARTSLYENSLRRYFKRDLPFQFFDGFGKVTTDFTSTGHASLEFLTTGDQIMSESPADPDFRWRNIGYSFSASYLFSDQYSFDFSITTSIYNAEQIPKSSSFIYYESSSIVDPAFYGNLTYFAGGRSQLDFGLLFNFPYHEAEFTNAFENKMTLSQQEVEPNMWVKYEWEAVKDLKVELGLRLDISRTFEYASGAQKGYLGDPRATFTYLIGENASVYFAAGSYHQRIINLTNEDDIYTPFDLIVAIPDTAENLDDEQAYHFVLGTQFIPDNIMKVKAEAYYKDFTKLVTVNRDKVDQNDPDFILGTGKAYGLELSLEYDLGAFYWSANYALSKVTNTSGGYTYEPRYGRLHQLNLSLGWMPVRNLWLRSHWEYGSGLPYTPVAGFYPQLRLDPNNLSGYTNAATTTQILFGKKNDAQMPPYHRLDASISYKLRVLGLDMTPQMTLINVYNRMNVFYVNNVSGDVEYSLPFILNFSLSWRI